MAHRRSMALVQQPTPIHPPTTPTGREPVLRDTLDQLQTRFTEAGVGAVAFLKCWRNALYVRYVEQLKRIYPGQFLVTWSETDFDKQPLTLSKEDHLSRDTVPDNLAETRVRIFDGALKLITITLYYRQRRSSGGTLLIQGKKKDGWVMEEYMALCRYVRQLRAGTASPENNIPAAIENVPSPATPPGLTNGCLLDLSLDHTPITPTRPIASTVADSPGIVLLTVQPMEDQPALHPQVYAATSLPRPSLVNTAEGSAAIARGDVTVLSQDLGGIGTTISDNNVSAASELSCTGTTTSDSDSPAITPAIGGLGLQLPAASNSELDGTGTTISDNNVSAAPVLSGTGTTTSDSNDNDGPAITHSAPVLSGTDTTISDSNDNDGPAITHAVGGLDLQLPAASNSELNGTGTTISDNNVSAASDLSGSLSLPLSSRASSRPVTPPRTGPHNPAPLAQGPLTSVATCHPASVPSNGPITPGRKIENAVPTYFGVLPLRQLAALPALRASAHLRARLQGAHDIIAHLRHDVITLSEGLSTAMARIDQLDSQLRDEAVKRTHGLQVSEKYLADKLDNLVQMITVVEQSQRATDDKVGRLSDARQSHSHLLKGIQKKVDQQLSAASPPSPCIDIPGQSATTAPVHSVTTPGGEANRITSNTGTTIRAGEDHSVVNAIPVRITPPVGGSDSRPEQVTLCPDIQTDSSRGHITKSPAEVISQETVAIDTTTLIIGDSVLKLMRGDKMSNGDNKVQVISVSGLRILSLAEWLTQQPTAPQVQSVTFHIGVNNCKDAEVSMTEWTQLIKLCRATFPQAALHASSILPAKQRDGLNLTITPSNTNLWRVCSHEGVAFIDNRATFCAASGAPKKALYRQQRGDVTHPSFKGMTLLAANIKRAAGLTATRDYSPAARGRNNSFNAGRPQYSAAVARHPPGRPVLHQQQRQPALHYYPQEQHSQMLVDTTRPSSHSRMGQQTGLNYTSRPPVPMSPTFNPLVYANTGTMNGTDGCMNERVNSQHEEYITRSHLFDPVVHANTGAASSNDGCMNNGVVSQTGDYNVGRPVAYNPIVHAATGIVNSNDGRMNTGVNSQAMMPQHYPFISAARPMLPPWPLMQHWSSVTNPVRVY